MLFGGNAGKRLEPMGKVGCAVVYRPVFHGAGNLARDVLAERGALFDRLFILFVGFIAKVFFHGFIAEHHTAEHLGKFHNFLLFWVSPGFNRFVFYIAVINL